MPVTSVIGDYRGEFSSDEAVWPVNQGRFTRRYDITFSDTPSEAGIRTVLALADDRVPRLWEALPGLPWVYVNDRQCEPGNGPLNLIAVINYITNPDPVNQPPVYEWLHAVSSEPFDTAADGFAILNSSNEASDPPIEAIPQLQASGQVATSFSLTLPVSGGFGGLDFEVTDGSLPPGLGLVGAVISGRPTLAGSFSATLQISDECPSGTQTSNVSVQIEIAEP